MKGENSADPSGLIFEAFRIEGISERDCRTIFFDWALGVPEGFDLAALVRELHEFYADRHPGHPMISVLAEGLQAPAAVSKRRGRRARNQLQPFSRNGQRSETGR